MNKCYHFTKNKYIDSILENGLVPMYKDNCTLLGDNRGSKISYSKGELNAIKMFASFYEIYYRVKDDFINYDLFDNSNIDVINEIKKSEDFSEWINDGPFIMFDGDSLINKNEDNLKDCYTTETISFDKLNVCVIKNKYNQDISLTNKTEIINYFIAKNSSDYNESINLGGFYAMNNKEEIEEFRNDSYYIDYVSLLEYKENYFINNCKNK